MQELGFTTNWLSQVTPTVQLSVLSSAGLGRAQCYSHCFLLWEVHISPAAISCRFHTDSPTLWSDFLFGK